MTTTGIPSADNCDHNTEILASNDRVHAMNRPELTSLTGASEGWHDTTFPSPSPSDVLFTSVSEINGVTALSVYGEIDATSLGSLAAHLQDIIDEGRPFLIDCTNSHFCSTAELSILSTLASRANRLSITWALAASGGTLRLLEPLEFDTKVAVFGSPSEAAAYVSAFSTEKPSA
ncbi:STAS domain-containing protein [Rhodococcus sp. KBS0724]|nr:STAS domain-containing protein [Rhodococcus sp. KBS0724]